MKLYYGHVKINFGYRRINIAIIIIVIRKLTSTDLDKIIAPVILALTIETLKIETKIMNIVETIIETTNKINIEIIILIGIILVEQTPLLLEHMLLNNNLQRLIHKPPN